MDRRTFIQNTGIIGGAAMLALYGFSEFNQPKFKLGYQLYSIRDAMEKNPLKTLKALKAMGYQDFETYGFDDQKGMFYGYTAGEFNSILNDLELTVSSGHFGFSPFLDQSDDALKHFVNRCIDGAKAVNSKYITWPFNAPEQRNLETFKAMPHKLNLIGEQVTKAGLGFAYHNHGYEFDDLGGTSGFDIIINETDPNLVKLQMDMYWVLHAGKKTPKQLIEEQPGRYVMWHIKDMDKITRDYSELGNGSINYHEILPDPKKSGLEFFYLEQGGNYAENSKKSASDSALYFKEELQKYL